MRKRLSLSRRAAHRADRSQHHGSHAAMTGPLVLGLICAFLGCAWPALAVSSERRPGSALTDVPGLEKRVTYSETKIPLGDLVAKVAAATGVPLTAARDVADEPVTVVVTEFPARELLEQLADLLDYRWSRRTTRVPAFRSDPAKAEHEHDSRARTRDRTPNSEHRTPEHLVRYEIYQDLAGKQREEALRQALSADVEQRFQGEIALCRELSRKSQEEMRRLWDEATRWYERLEKLTPAERQALLNSPEGRRQDLRHDYARYLWSPIQRSLAGFIDRLSPEQWAALREGWEIVFSSDSHRSRLPLPPDVLQDFRTSRHTVSPPGQPRSTQPDREERARQREREHQELWAQADQYNVTLRFESGWGKPGAIKFLVLPEVFAGGKQLRGSYGGYDNPYLMLHIYPEDTVSPTVDDPQRRARLEQDPLLSVKKPFRPDPRPYVDPLFPGTARSFRFLPEWLPGLARAYGVDFIADSYWGATRAPDAPSLGGSAPLFEVLDRLAGSGHTWDRRGGGGPGERAGPPLIRFRDRRWFVDRPGETPLHYVRRWVAMSDRLGALSLEELALAAANLTDLQLNRLASLDLFEKIFPPPLTEYAQNLYHERFTLRFYAGLSRTQRQALQAGQPLATAQLSPALQRLILAELNRVHRLGFPLQDLEQWGGGHLSLSRTPDVRIREQRGKLVTFRLESSPAPRPATPPDAVTRFPVTRLPLPFDYGAPTPARLMGIVVAASEPPE